MGVNLTNEKIGYKSLRESVITFLQDNVASLNTNMTDSISTSDIRKGHPLITPIYTFPSILIKMGSKTEEFVRLGRAGRKLPELTFEIFPMVQIMTGGQDDDDELLTLCDNIEGLFRDNISMDDTFIWTNPAEMDPYYLDNEESTYIAMARILLTAQKEVI